MNAYHTVTPEVRDLILRAESAVRQLAKANSGSFATTHALEQAHVAAKELHAVSEALTAALTPPKVVPLKRRTAR
jgi:hypothetical protein